jgi:hypothetical protein
VTLLKIRSVLPWSAPRSCRHTTPWHLHDDRFKEAWSGTTTACPLLTPPNCVGLPFAATRRGGEACGPLPNVFEYATRILGSNIGQCPDTGADGRIVASEPNPVFRCSKTPVQMLWKRAKFFRGHMTRREDPVGHHKVASRAHDDSMLSPTRSRRCIPSTLASGLNQENYALFHARQDGITISIFSGRL